MDAARLTRLLEEIRAGHKTVADGVEDLTQLPFVDLGHSHVDTHRGLRCGAAEVVFGEGKSTPELLDIARTLVAAEGRLLVTRVAPDAAEQLCAELPGARHHARARLVTVGEPEDDPAESAGGVLVLSAGTADGPVAQEALVTARMLGAPARHIADVGVAGIHRLLAHVPELRSAAVVIVVAGMEGALPSVVGGLVDKPVIGVPTSVGYGTGSGGVAALLSMLNSCAAGVTVVNIDNGFGAGYAASTIHRLQGTRAE